jgi:predicted AlkP superfamily pyrophosphatase or phosphodiesterase
MNKLSTEFKMPLKALFFLVFLSFSSCIAQQSHSQKATESNKTKLVVGIVVDQMRYDFLYRFEKRYGNDGFKRLLNDGFNCKNNHYHYASTVTGPGHAHVYNGSVPAVSGIVGNDWYDKVSKTKVYVVSDTAANTVGEGSAGAGKMSPANMKVTTMTDQLMMATQFKSKVVGVGIKDRGAILPAGHTGDAYWFDSSTGNWITSTHYTDKLPNWVEKFNKKNIAQKYAAMTWETLYPINTYEESEEDNQPYENRITGETEAVFPHKIDLGSLAASPWGNTLTLDIALEALTNESLGTDDITDFLAISFSSPDYAGHAFGPQSKEIEDIYLRLDLEIARLLKTLDKEVGKDNYTVFLTADHGVAEIPAYLRKHDLPAGLLLSSEYTKPAEAILKEKLGEGEWLISNANYELYLNRELMAEKGVSVEQIKDLIAPTINLIDGVYSLINLENLSQDNVPPFYKEKLQNIYNPKRSGELMLLVEPSWFTGYSTRGTTHGSMWSYDTHVPLLFYGNGINKGETVNPTYISDIAPTISQLLNIQEPSGSVGKPITDVLK